MQEFPAILPHFTLNACGLLMRFECGFSFSNRRKSWLQSAFQYVLMSCLIIIQLQTVICDL